MRMKNALYSTKTTFNFLSFAWSWYGFHIFLKASSHFKGLSLHLRLTFGTKYCCVIEKMPPSITELRKNACRHK